MRNTILSILLALVASIGTIFANETTYTVVFDYSDFAGQGISGTGGPVKASKDGVTFECDKAYGDDQYGVRCYKGSNISISANTNIIGIEFEFSLVSGIYYNGGLDSLIYIGSTNWQQTIASQARMTNIKVVLGSTIKAQVAPENSGKVRITIVNSAINEVELRAIANNGYHFVQWSDNLMDNPRSVIIDMTKDTTFTAEFELITSGKCGDNLTWSYSDGVLTISGSGDMYNGDAEWDYVLRPKIKTVIIEDGVTSIGNSAFSLCDNVTSVTIPHSVTSIGNYAFYYCSGLTSIEIPNSVTSIGDRAFEGCSGLTSIEIPNSVTSIGDRAFTSCSSLTSVVWNAKNCIGSSGFGGSVESFIFGDEVERIPSGCCSGMYKLKSIEIPKNVTSIGDYAFSDCSGLTSIEIPNSVTNIGGSAFAYCTGLTSIEIPNSVTSIGGYAFDDCTGLTSISIGRDVPIVDYWRICGTIDGKNVHNHPNLTQVEAPAWFFDVEENNWSYCPKYMTNINVNAGTLTDNAFSVIKRNYKTLNALDIGNVENTTLADEAFKDNYNLTELILPAGLTSVSYMAVAGCKNLKSIDIPASVEEIDQSAFEDCRSIETITFGGKQPSSKPGLRMEAAESKLRKIGNWAFYNAHQLQHLEIPEGVEEIGDGAFYGCTYLQDLILPKSIKAIGDNCFALCSHLERIDIEALTPPTIFARTFFDVSRQIPVYVPEDVVAEYLNDEYWKEMNIQGAPTAIEEVSGQQSEVRNQKIMRNGQLLILSNGGTYNAQGVRVE